MSLTFTYVCWLPVKVPPSDIDTLLLSYCLLCLLAVSHSLSFPIEMLHVSHSLFQIHGVSACLSLFPMVAGSLSRFHSVVACLSLSPMVAGSLLLFIQHPKSFCMSLTFSYGCWLSLTIFPVPWSYYMSLSVFYSCWVSLTVFPIPGSCSYCLLWLLVVSLSIKSH